MEYTLDHLLACHCAPTLARIKPANLVSCAKAQFSDLPNRLTIYQQALAPCGIRFELMCGCNNRYLLLVYHEDLLAKQLAAPRVKQLLAQFGYHSGSTLQELIAHLRRRIAQTDGFPHEVGLFLGYPVEDVIGFIRHAGRNCKLCGYWKVYGDAQAAAERFHRFTQVSRAVMQRVEAGESLLRMFAAA